MISKYSTFQSLVTRETKFHKVASVSFRFFQHFDETRMNFYEKNKSNYQLCSMGISPKKNPLAS